MANYILAQSYNKANIQDRLWYVMNETDKATLVQNEKVCFGDKAWIIVTKKMYIMGNDNTWYEM